MGFLNDQRARLVLRDDRFRRLLRTRLDGIGAR
ncbi:hypothetical protein ACVWZ4_006762 [Bradyrhizobium sp. USDA 4472]